jgi:uncharacterized protein YfiM (DUF2279 family)
VTQNKKRVKFEKLTDIGEAVEDKHGHSDAVQQPVQCEVLTGCGQNIEDSSGHSDKESTHGQMSGYDRLWTE